MKIVFFELEDWEKELFSSRLHNVDGQFFSDPLTLDTVGAAEDADIISTFIYSHVQRGTLEKLQNVRLIATRSTGVDHIDKAYCKERGIGIANVPVYGEHTVAEHTFALLLSLSRNIPQSIERTRHGSFSADGLRGFELFGKTIGIVGAGAIGRVVAKIALGFGMHVVIHNRTVKQELVDMGCQLVDFPTLLAQSDVISFHLPDAPDTHHILNRDTIQLCKKKPVIINTARGGVIDTEALVWALEQGIIKAAGLDVLEVEHGLKEERQLVSREFLKNHELKTQLLNMVILRKDSVVVTPHNAFNSDEALRTIIEVTIRNIESFLTNGKPEFSVSTD